jgi:hypothetical protein
MRDIYKHHEPTPEAIDLMNRLREKFSELHELIAGVHPNREISLALTNLEQSAMWANKGVIVATTVEHGSNK